MNKSQNIFFCAALLVTGHLSRAMVEDKIRVATVVTKNKVSIREERDKGFFYRTYDSAQPTKLTTTHGQEELQHDSYKKLTEICSKLDCKDMSYELEFLGYYTTGDPRLTITRCICWRKDVDDFDEDKFSYDNDHEEELDECKEILTGLVE